MMCHNRSEDLFSACGAAHMDKATLTLIKNPKILTRYLANQGMEYVFLPTHSPDLNPVVIKIFSMGYKPLCIVQFRPCCQVWRLGPLDLTLRHTVVSSRVTVCPCQSYRFNQY